MAGLASICLCAVRVRRGAGGSQAGQPVVRLNEAPLQSSRGGYSPGWRRRLRPSQRSAACGTRSRSSVLWHGRGKHTFAGPEAVQRAASSVGHTMDYLATPLRLRAAAAPLCAALGVRNPLCCEHLQLVKCPISQTFRNCVLRGTHTRARCMCALGTVAEGVLVAMGARRSAGEGAMEFQAVPGARTSDLDRLSLPQPCPKLLKNDVELFYFHAHRTKARATHQAPPRDTAPGAACPSAPSNTRRRQHPIQLRSRATGLFGFGSSTSNL